MDIDPKSREDHLSPDITVRSRTPAIDKKKLKSEIEKLGGKIPSTSAPPLP